MSESTEWSLREVGDLLLRVIILLVVLAFIGAIVYFLTKTQPEDPAIPDFERVVGELEELMPGETIKVPLLSTGHKLVIIPTQKVLELGLDCRVDQGNVCACLKKEDAILRCKSFDFANLPDNEKIQISSTDEIAMESNNGLTLSYIDGVIRIS